MFMIKVRAKENDIYEISAFARSPTVYLDHWAVVKIAKRTEWKDRFIKTLHEKNGTFFISIMNIHEIARSNNDTQTNVKSFLEGIGKNWFFIDIDPVAVIKKEESRQQGENSPCFHEVGLKNFYPYIHDEEPTLGKMIDLIKNTKGVFDKSREGFDKLRVRMAETQKKIQRNDPSIPSDAYEPGNFIPERPTKYVYHTLMRSILWGKKNIETNDVIDLYHSTISLAYADFVLLDKHWYTQALNLLQQIPDLKDRLFRDGEKEMNRFLCSFENF